MHHVRCASYHLGDDILASKDIRLILQQPGDPFIVRQDGVPRLVQD
jgi:hypothetical protein